MQDFRNLKVWQKAHQLTLDVYDGTRRYPEDERYGITSQTRRAAYSIPSNIAEGCGRGTDCDFARFLQIAMGSAIELEYHLLLGRDLKMLPAQRYQGLAQATVEVKRMLASLLQRLKAEG